MFNTYKFDLIKILFVYPSCNNSLAVIMSMSSDETDIVCNINTECNPSECNNHQFQFK